MQDLSSLTGKVEAQSLNHSAAQEGSMVASKIVFKNPPSLYLPHKKETQPRVQQQ